MSAVTWLVGNMHVGTSDRDLVRELYRRIRHTPDGSRRPLPLRSVRRSIYREALEAHHANQDLCRQFRL